MNRVLAAVLLPLFCTSCEGLSKLLFVENNSDEAIYVSFSCGRHESLPAIPKLELYEFFDNSAGGSTDVHGKPLPSAYYKPNYRIEAHKTDTLSGGIEPRLFGEQPPEWRCTEDEATLFVLTEETMRLHDWETIVGKQLYTKKVVIKRDEWERNNYTYRYVN